MQKVDFRMHIESVHETNEENDLEFKLILNIERHQGLGHINMTLSLDL